MGSNHLKLVSIPYLKEWNLRKKKKRRKKLRSNKCKKEMELKPLHALIQL